VRALSSSAGALELCGRSRAPRALSSSALTLYASARAVVSFFSYRYFRAYTYYSVSVVAYESLVLAAFLMLLLQYIGESNEEQRRVLKDKEKRKIPFPFCCVRFRPSKPCASASSPSPFRARPRPQALTLYPALLADFIHGLKWSVLQCASTSSRPKPHGPLLSLTHPFAVADSLLRPLISIIEIICQAYDVLCPTQYSVYFAGA